MFRRFTILAVAVVIAALGCFAPPALAIHGSIARADSTSGFDVSFPNCGQTLPTSRRDVAIVGVEGGRSFTTNPCLADEFHWAGANGAHYQVYINTSYPAGSQIHRGDTGPKGHCSPNDWACKAYNYGYNNAEFAFHYAQTQYAVADTWWLDVETANSWSDNPALNARVIQGAVDALRAHGLQVGIYSIAPMWKEIVGDYQVNLPTWVVRLRASVDTGAYCSAAHGFGGGSTALVQDEFGKVDADLSCPGNAFAGLSGYIPYPLTQTQYATLFGTHGGVSTYYALPTGASGTPQSVTLDFAPSGADVANALFLAVSQGNLQLASARATDTPTPGHLRLSFTPTGSGPIVVRLQSFNFEDTPPISYAISPG
jgi:hypothetical protein